MGVGNEMGEPIKIESADDHIFGFVLMNDWSGEHAHSMMLALMSGGSSLPANFTLRGGSCLSVDFILR